MTAHNLIGKQIASRIFDLPGTEHLIKGPGKYDFLIGAVAERKVVHILTGRGAYNLQVNGLDWISEDSWAFRGFATRTSKILYDGDPQNGLVEGVIRVRPDKDLLRGFMIFIS